MSFAFWIKSQKWIRFLMILIIMLQLYFISDRWLTSGPELDFSEHDAKNSR